MYTHQLVSEMINIKIQDRSISKRTDTTLVKMYEHLLNKHEQSIIVIAKI